MSTKEQRRQRKLAKKRSKQISERKTRAREKNSLQSVAGQMKAASTGEIDRCLIGSGLLNPNRKFGTVVISRRMPDGRLGCARILVDGMCLGVKDAHGLVIFPGQMTELLEKHKEVELLRPAPPADARKLVEDAIEYARRFGLEAAADYQKIASIWGDIDPRDSSAEFQFGGADGKPIYVPAEHDSEYFRDKVVATLTASAGEGNFEVDDEALSYPAEDEYAAWTNDPELDVDIDQDVMVEPEDHT